MKRVLSRRQSLSLGFFGLGALAAWSCGGEASSPAGAGGSAGASGGSGGSAGSGGASGGTGGASGSGGSTGGAGGATGGSGGATGGAGGATGGSGGATGGSGGATGGAGGATGGASGSGGAGGSGGGKDAGAGDGGNAGCGMQLVALISMNHGHALTVPTADVTAGVDKIYNARGTASHDHFVQVTAMDFMTLKAGGTVIKRSCNGGDHEYVISCVTPSRQPAAPTCNGTADECGLTMGMLCP
ncbi:MAG: hypothetical protein ABW133_19655 [Polyangiaceae bacterium]